MRWPTPSRPAGRPCAASSAAHFKVWKGVSALCRDFIDKCLNKNRKKRMTAKQAQAHPWIKRAAKAMEGTPLSKEAMLSMAKFQATNTFEK